MIYNRDKDFAQLIDQIDAHVFTGDTLFNATNLERLRIHIGRWERAVKEQDHLNQVILQEYKDNGEEPNPIYYYKVVSTQKSKVVYFESDRTFKHPHAVMMKCRQEDLFDVFDEVESFTEITQKEYWEGIF